MTSSEGAPSRITEIASESPARGLARSLIKSLARGTAIAEGVRYIHVGHEGWLSSQDEILSEVAEDGYSETKFVRGAYGAGKSHFLSVVQDRARERKWCTSHIECKVDKVQIDRFETLYPKVAEKLLSKDILKIRADSADQNGPHPIRFLLERWVHEQLRAVGVRDEAISRPFDADRRLHARLQDGLLRSNLSPDFTRALAVFARATLAGDQETADAVVRWLSGVDERIILPAAYLQKIAPSGAVLGKPVIVRPHQALA